MWQQIECPRVNTAVIFMDIIMVLVVILGGLISNYNCPKDVQEKSSYGTKKGSPIQSTH